MLALAESQLGGGLGVLNCIWSGSVEVFWSRVLSATVRETTDAVPWGKFSRTPNLLGPQGSGLLYLTREGP